MRSRFPPNWLVSRPNWKPCSLFAQVFMRQSNLYFLLWCGSNTPWVDSALQSTFISSQVLEEMERAILCSCVMSGHTVVAGMDAFCAVMRFMENQQVWHFQLTTYIPVGCDWLQREVLKIQNTSDLIDMMMQWVTLLASDKCQALEYAVVCSSDIDQ